MNGFKKAQTEYESRMFNPYDYMGESTPRDIWVKIKVTDEQNIDDVISSIEKIADVLSAEFGDYAD